MFISLYSLSARDVSEFQYLTHLNDNNCHMHDLIFDQADCRVM